MTHSNRLTEYIKINLHKGYSAESITKALVAHGYDSNFVAHIVRSVETEGKLIRKKITGFDLLIGSSLILTLLILISIIFSVIENGKNFALGPNKPYFIQYEVKKFSSPEIIQNTMYFESDQNYSIQFTKDGMNQRVIYGSIPIYCIENSCGSGFNMGFYQYGVYQNNAIDIIEFYDALMNDFNNTYGQYTPISSDDGNICYQKTEEYLICEDDRGYVTSFQVKLIDDVYDFSIIKRGKLR